MFVFEVFEVFEVVGEFEFFCFVVEYYDDDVVFEFGLFDEYLMVVGLIVEW